VRSTTQWISDGQSAVPGLILKLSSEAAGAPAPLHYSLKTLSKSNAVSRFSMQ
jgi:hypothetical protein